MLTTRVLLRSAKLCYKNQLIFGDTVEKVHQIGSVIRKCLPAAVQTQHRFMSSSSSIEKTNEKNIIKVYYGSLTPRMKAVKVFSLTTSIAGLAAQPILMEQGVKIGGTGMAIFLCSFAGFFTFVTPLLLHFITKKYVTEILYNELTEEYTATTISIILRKKQTTFKVADVKVPDVPGMFSSITVGNMGLFIDPSQFIDPEHYVKIMGYDKPIDFKLDLTENHGTIEDSKNVKKSS